jgi:hypothetical protein
MRALDLEIVILSHLSDSSIEISINPELAKKRIEFVKHLVIKLGSGVERMSEDELNKIWGEI